MNEKTFYKDEENSYESYPVAVETGLLRVRDDSYSLAGVSATKLDVTLAPYDFSSRKSLNEKRAWACICGVIAIVGYMMGQHLFLLFGIGVIVIGYFAMLARQEADVKRDFVAKIILSRRDGETAVVIGCWHRLPDDFAVGTVRRLGYDEDLWRKIHFEKRRRAEVIAQAIGSAIRDQSLAGLQ